MLRLTAGALVEQGALQDCRPSAAEHVLRQQDQHEHAAIKLWLLPRCPGWADSTSSLHTGGAGMLPGVRALTCCHVQNFHKLVEFDGLWLDMDEVSNYCTGDVCQNPGEMAHKLLHRVKGFSMLRSDAEPRACCASTSSLIA